MTKAELRATLAAELARIPNPERSLTQALLRSAYLRLREVSLGQAGGSAEPPGDVLAAAVASVRRKHPRVRFVYDRAFFGGGGRRAG